MTPQFQKSYDMLNAAQKKAVDTIEGPVMVMAGPGTGKTQVLATRIAKILLETDTQPHNILALTFTDAAAQNMRARLVTLIGVTGYQVRVQTFHSFCQEVIQTYPEYFTLPRRANPLTDLQRYSIFEEILSQLDLEVLKPINRPLFYLRECITQISQLKREGVTIEKFIDLVQQATQRLEAENGDLTKSQLAKESKNLAKQTELVRVYTQYQHLLSKRDFYDFDDMIVFVSEAFQKQEELLLSYQESLQYFLADEYQDTNTAQNQILNSLASYWGEQANIFVVGDPHQSIYRFQGASIENTLQFLHAYPEAHVVTLVKGYRCPQRIYDAAHDVIGNNVMPHLETQDKVNCEAKEDTLGYLASVQDNTNGILQQSLSQRLESQINQIGKILVKESPVSVIELETVAQDVKNLIEGGEDASEIAVLFRKNSDALALQSVFDLHNIRYEIDAGGNIFESESIIQLLTLFKVMLALRSDEISEELFQLLCFDWVPVERKVVFQLGRIAGRSRLELSELLSMEYKEIEKLQAQLLPTQEEFAQTQDWFQQLQEWSRLDATTIFTLWFETVISASGYLSWLQSHEKRIEYLIELTTLFREITSQVQANRDFKLSDFLSMVDVMQTNGIGIKADDLDVSEDAVTLSTAHKAKGKEWNHVFIVNAVDGQWGNGKKRELLPLPEGILQYSDQEEQKNDDDRRLWYVAITRAKKSVTISYSNKIISGSSTRMTLPSMFLTEMEGHVQNEVISVDKEALESVLTQQVKIKTPLMTTNSEKEFFKKLVTDFRLSSSSLNLYLRDPQEFVKKVLLRIPQATVPTLAYGTAMHFALEKLYQHVVIHNDYPDKEKIIHFFKTSLQRELIDSQEYDRRLKIGTQTITAYFENLPSEVRQPLYLEKFFGNSSSQTYLGDIAISGRIDRIDLVSKKEKLVKVIDYKTGKARSANEIEAKTKTSQQDFSERELALPETIRGPYKRQLLFYKLLTELDPQFPFTATVGEFDFVEPSKISGKLVKRTFDLYQDEVEDLKELIQEVMEEIRELEFLS